MLLKTLRSLVRPCGPLLDLAVLFSNLVNQSIFLGIFCSCRNMSTLRIPTDLDLKATKEAWKLAVLAKIGSYTKIVLNLFNKQIAFNDMRFVFHNMIFNSCFAEQQKHKPNITHSNKTGPKSPWTGRF